MVVAAVSVFVDVVCVSCFFFVVFDVYCDCLILLIVLFMLRLFVL